MVSIARTSSNYDLRKEVFLAYQRSRGIDVVFEPHAGDGTQFVPADGLLSQSSIQYLLPEIRGKTVGVRECNKSPELLRELYDKNPAAAHIIDRLLAAARRERKKAGLSV